MEMGIKGFMVYLLSASSIAILSVFLILPNHSSIHNDLTTTIFSRTARVWPDLEVSWKSATATLIGFVGSAFGTVGGVGGGGIFVTMLNVIVGFDTKSAAALSKCMIMGASMSSVWYNMQVAHPTKEVPIIDYDLALLFQPMLMLGITIGVSLSVVFPYWLVTILIIILFLGTSSRSFFKATLMWKEETLKMEEAKREQQALSKCNSDEVVIGSDYQPLPPHEEKSKFEILCSNIRWRGILVLILVWCSFLLLQISKNQIEICSPIYWVINIMQFPVSIIVFIWEAVTLYLESKNRRRAGNSEYVCEAAVGWTTPQLLFCAFRGILGGTVGGLLGSGGGFILGPLLLEFGVIPQVASATATFVMMFSSSLSVVEFYFLDRFPILYALYLTSVSVVAGFWGQYLVRKLVVLMKRASVIVFILSSVIFVSALIMGIVGIEKSIDMIHQHEYMGFLSFCEK